MVGQDGSVVQSEAAVTAYLKSNQLLLLAFTRPICPMQF